MQKKADLYDKFSFYLMAVAGLAMWVLVAYALYDVSQTGGTPL